MYNPRVFGMLILSVALVIVSCGVNLIAPYNQAVVDGVIELNAEVDGLLTDIERHFGTAEAAYDNYTDMYDQLHVDVRSLVLQVDCIPKSGITVDQLENLDWLIAEFEAAHSDGAISALDIPMYRNGFAEACKTVVELELSKLE